MSRAAGRSLVRTAFAALVIAALVVGPATSVSAHTDLESSSPAADSTVDVPVGEITLTFTEPVTPVANAFEVLDPQGNISTPSFGTTDDVVYVLTIDPPIGGGEVGVRYEVASADGHVVDGAFAFTVSAPPPTATTSPTTTALATAPPTTAPPTTALATTAPATPATEPPVIGPPVTEPPPPSRPPVTTTASSTTASSTTASSTSLDVSTTVAGEADAGNGSNAWWWIGGIVVVAAAAGGVALWMR
jgi:methionine-rich copper-binding protein CopC